MLSGRTGREKQMYIIQVGSNLEIHKLHVCQAATMEPMCVTATMKPKAARRRTQCTTVAIAMQNCPFLYLTQVTILLI